MNNRVRASDPSSVGHTTTVRSSTPAGRAVRRWSLRTPARVLALAHSRFRNPASMRVRPPAQTPVPSQISAPGHLSRPIHMPRMSARGPTLMSTPVQFPTPAQARFPTQATPPAQALPPTQATLPNQLLPRIQLPPPIQFPPPIQTAPPVQFLAPVQTPSPVQTPFMMQYLRPADPVRTQPPLADPMLSQIPTATRPQTREEAPAPSLRQAPLPVPQSGLQSPAVTQNLIPARTSVPVPQSGFQTPTLTQNLVPARAPIPTLAPQSGPIPGQNLIRTPETPSSPSYTPSALVPTPATASALEPDLSSTSALDLAPEPAPAPAKDSTLGPAGKAQPLPSTTALRPAQEPRPVPPPSVPPNGTDMSTQRPAGLQTTQGPNMKLQASNLTFSFPPVWGTPKEQLEDDKKITIRVIYCYSMQYTLLKSFLEEHFPNHLNFETDISAQFTGEFEVFVEGKLVHSKKKGEGFLNDTKLLQIVNIILEEMKKR